MRADLYENLSMNFKFSLSRKKISQNLHEDVNTFYCFRLHKLAINASYYNSHYICTETVTFSSTVHTEQIVAFPLQQCLCEQATIVSYTYFAYLVDI